MSGPHLLRVRYLGLLAASMMYSINQLINQYI